MCTYQVNIRHKVSKKCSWDPKSPDSVTENFENGEIANLLCRRKFGLSLLSSLVFGVGNKGFVRKSSQEENKHNDAEDPQGVVQVNRVDQDPQEEGQRHCEQAAARGDNAIHEPKALLEVVPENDQRRLVGKRAATGKQDPIGEVQRFNGAVPKEKNKPVLCKAMDAHFHLP